MGKMYSQQPKILVRPRSSLSNEDHHRLKDAQKSPKPSILVLSLIGSSVFLLVLCACLITALVLVGKNYANSSSNISHSKSDGGAGLLYRGINESSSNYFGYHQNTKPVVIFRPNQVNEVMQKPHEKTLTNVDTEMSKVLGLLSFRLPKEIRPNHYSLLLHPNLQEKTFTGQVKISLDVLKPTLFIPVHSKKLNVTNTLVQRILKSGATEPVSIARTFEYEPHEYWVTEFDDALSTGQYEIDLTFNGSLVNRIVGFYQSSYFDTLSNETRMIATSKFEPTFARQAFPCFDEPNMKAKFKVTLIVPNDSGYHGLSNMDIDDMEKRDQNTHVVFKESVPMSTYLACFIVSDFGYQETQVSVDDEGKILKMRVYATKAQIEKVKYALDTGAKIIKYYIDYFKIPYPLPKLDMIAIPDFVSGAMEHWGLVTYRETALLYDSKISSTANKQRVGEVIAHELAHMWFGNLVTMDWWNDLWLNEGFASYIQYKGLLHAEPDWQLMDQFLLKDLHGVLKLDATLASHPIVQTVESPDEITELFDTITYSKGSSIIRMLENFVTETKFQQAVTNYLNKYKYKNAKTKDLLKEIDALEPGVDIEHIMATWTEQMGFPVLNVERKSSTVFKVTQKRFFANPEDAKIDYKDSPYHYRWFIPITYITNDNLNDVQKISFDNNDNEVEITVPATTKWIKINKDQIGYYRVNYETEMWIELTTALLRSKDLSVSDRAHLLNDVFALADAEQLKYDTALDLTKYLRTESEYVPWSVAASKLNFLKNMLYFTEELDLLQKYGISILSSVYATISWEPSVSHVNNLLRTTVIDLACSMGMEDCLQKAKIRFDDFVKDPAVRPDPDVRSIVYNYGMASVTDFADWEKVWNLFLQEPDASEKLKLMSGLAAIKVPAILQKYVELAWDEKNVRGQDYFTCIQNIASNRVGEPIVWDYVRQHWPDLVERFGLNERYLGRMIPSITSRFNTKIRLQEMEDFFVRHPDAGAGAAARKQALENVKANIKWFDVNKENVTKWLHSNSQ